MLQSSPLTKQDIAALTPIMAAAFDDDSKTHTGVEHDGPRGYDDGSLLLRRLADPALTCRKVFLDGSVIGAWTVRQQAAQCTLELFFLDPALHNQGLGQQVWQQIEEELEPVTAAGKKAFILQSDRESFRCADTEEALLLLGPHDPYLDIRDRAILLEDTGAQRQVWRTVGNPGVVLKGGKIIGIWKTRTQREKLSVTAALWEPFSASEQRELKQHLEGYAAFRGLALQSLTRL